MEAETASTGSPEAEPLSPSSIAQAMGFSTFGKAPNHDHDHDHDSATSPPRSSSPNKRRRHNYSGMTAAPSSGANSVGLGPRAPATAMGSTPVVTLPKRPATPTGVPMGSISPGASKDLGVPSGEEGAGPGSFAAQGAQQTLDHPGQDTRANNQKQQSRQGGRGGGRHASTSGFQKTRNGVWQGDEEGYFDRSFLEDPWAPQGHGNLGR
ncbi:MAG: transport between ER and Golgi ATPase protein [Chaenotheca gracillima]|nr:MAG: transport between ER and Golgi ATPase protein [Chaenotheca gracillima]